MSSLGPAGPLEAVLITQGSLGSSQPSKAVPGQMELASEGSSVQACFLYAADTVALVRDKVSISVSRQIPGGGLP